MNMSFFSFTWRFTVTVILLSVFFLAAVFFLFGGILIFVDSYSETPRFGELGFKHKASCFLASAASIAAVAATCSWFDKTMQTRKGQ